MLPNLGGVNVLIHGLLGEGVAASTRFDPQAKGLGEWVRSRTCTSRRRCCERSRRLPPSTRWTARPRGAAGDRDGVRPARGRAVPPGVGGRRRDPARAAPRPPRGRACSARLPGGGRRRGRRPARHDRDAGGDVRGRRVQRADGRRCSPTASRCRTSPPTASPDLVDRYVRPTLAGEMIGALAVTEPGGGSDVAGIRTTAAVPRRRPLRRQRRQDVHHQRRARRLRHDRRPHRAARATRHLACSSSTRARRASPSTATSTRWAGTAPTPPSCPSSTCGCRRPTWSARRTPASSRSPSSSSSSGSRSRCTPTASRPAALALDRGVLPRARDVRQAAGRQPGGAAQARRDAPAGRGRAHLHARGRAPARRRART